MEKISLWGLDEEVEIETEKIQKIICFSTDDIYEEAYQLPDGRWIAFEDAVSSWIMLGYDTVKDIEIL